ncbi:hypothetical protein RM780_20355 [Streptomyces sp. DSM 44917]|uniref:Uncharacterized protein n=1 Tax=Streptomyces boetiae TaxID=3075541 RepID=A0ABU2LCJ7_9ACTN|nr:hypothetical protein [Streptomyces sp. DSM 44917]MDT0309295.1 hypothetical protein [Streptomyces sp. DSM 44917]
MAHNPQAPGPDQDPAGSTQMFQAFVNDTSAPQRSERGGGSGGVRPGVILGAVLAVAVVIGLVWLALG